MHTWLSLVILLISINSSSATIRNVPADYRTIMAGIEAAEDGDTVLVARGNYRENINFGGKQITVASNYLLTLESDDIYQTILFGDESSVVRFDHNEGEDSRLIGFTLTGGTGTPDLDNVLGGGGVHCLRASPTLAHLIITACTARYGAGIFLQHSSAIVSDCVIIDNESDRGGGAIYCSRETSRPSFTRVLMVNSNSHEGGDIVGLYQGAEVTFTNCTFIGTEAQGQGGLGFRFYLNCKVWLRNCVMVPIQAADIGLDRASDSLFVDYSILAGGREGIHFSTRSGILVEGEGYTEGEPLIDLVGYKAYSPSWFNFPIEDATRSPQIDSGDPESPEDPDGTRADMGAIPFNQNSGRLQGVVRSFLTGAPIAGAMIQDSHSVNFTTDNQGAFAVPIHSAGEFQLQVRAPGFNDSLLTGLNLEQHDTLDLDIRLLNPSLVLGSDEYSFHVTEGTTREFPLELQNRGNGSLEYKAKAEPTAEFAFKVGDVISSIDLNEHFEAERFFAPSIIDGDYFIPGLSPDRSEKLIFGLSRNLHRAYQFPQPPNSERYGLESIVAIDSTFWSCFADTLVEFDGNGDAIRYLQVPGATNLSYITYDPVGGLIWVENSGRKIIAFDPSMSEVVDSISFTYTIRGLGFFTDDPDGYQLYILWTLPVGPQHFYLKFRTADGDTMHVATLNASNRQGCCVVPNYEHWGNTAILTYNKHLDDTEALEAIQISDRIRWISLIPFEGVIQAGRSTAPTLSINASELIPEFYPLHLVIDHNAEGMQTVVPINLTVTPLSVPNETFQPETFSLSAFPNPFNSTVTIRFSTGSAARPTRLAIYDVTGRLVTDLSPRLPQLIAANKAKVVWDSGAVGAGVYFVRLEDHNTALNRKVILIK